MKYFVAIFLFLSLVIADENKTITWLINDAKPYYIDSGELQDQGFGDLTQKALMDAMPQYKHIIKKSPLSRVMKDFEHKKTSVFPHGYITQLQSLPLLPYQIFIICL